MTPSATAHIRSIRSRLGVFWFALPVMLGCGSETPPKDDRPPLEGQSVRVLVVDDAPLAAAVGELKTAWKQRSGAELSVAETSAAKLATSEKPEADVIIYPSPYLGTLAEQQWFSPLPEQALASDDLKWPDVFPALREREATWGARTVALPLGSRVLACFYRADLLKRSGKQPPETWSDYQALVDFFSDRGSLGAAAPPAGQHWAATAEPLADGWAGMTLLARAASYAKHRDYFTVLFNPSTMAPRIDGPPFVRALEELVAANRLNSEQAASLSPQDALNELLAGRCALALGWPAGRGAKEGPTTVRPSDVAGVPLPGSKEAFLWDRGQYEQGPLRRVPLLACEGRMMSVAAAAQHPTAANQLAIALAAGDWGVRVSSASQATTVFRSSQLAAARQWTSADSPVAAAYARAVADSLGTQEVVYALRIPGRGEYLAALDKAVRTAVSGQAKPEEALKTAAAQWQTITQKHGIDAQRRACEHSDVRIAF
jgi:multiple sugar transport system substrate-binding protein